MKRKFMKRNIRRKTKKNEKKRIRKTKTHRKVVKGGLLGVNIMTSSNSFEWKPNTNGFLGMIDWSGLNKVYVIYKNGEKKNKISQDIIIEEDYFNKNLQFFLDNRWKADLLGSGIYIVFEKAYDALGNSPRIRFSDLGITDKEQLLNAKIVVVSGFLIAYIIQYTPVMIKIPEESSETQSTIQSTRISNENIFTEHKRITSVFHNLTVNITYASNVNNFLKNNNFLGIFNSVRGIDVYHRSTGHPEYTTIFSNFLKGIYNSNASRLSNFLPFLSGSDNDMKKTMEEYFLPEILGISSW
jgi:hypothetical protein